MDIPLSVRALKDRACLDKQNEERFWMWVNPYEDKDLFAVFDSALCALNILQELPLSGDSVAEAELSNAFGRIVSHSFAVLALFEKGFLSEAHSILRTVGEGRNLLLLLTKNKNELNIYLSADEGQRDKRFSAGKVRRKLNGIGIDPFMADNLYGRVSRRFSHFSTGSTALNTNPYDMSIGRLEYDKSNVNLSILAWAWSIYIVLRIAVEFLECLQEDSDITRLVSELGSANYILENRLRTELSAA